MKCLAVLLALPALGLHVPTTRQPPGRHAGVRCVVSPATPTSNKPPSLPARGSPTRLRVKPPVRRAGKNWKVVALHRRAQAAIRAGNFEEGRELLRKGLKLDARDAHSWLSLARLEARVGDAEEARRLFVRATHLCPDNVRLVHANAVFEAKAGHKAAARALFESAAELEPGNAYVSHAWGLLEESAGNASAAQRIYADLMDARPQAQVCVAWAALEAREGNLARAREIYERGWRLYGLGTWDSDDDDDVDERLPVTEGGSTAESVDLLVEWSALECAAGNLTAARTLLDRGKRLSPHAVRVHVATAQLHLQQGESDEARRTFAASAARPSAGSPEHAEEYVELFNTWAAFEARAGDLAAATSVLARGRELYPADASLLQSLGTLQRRTGDVDGARTSFEASIRLEPRGATYVAYALLEAELGRAIAARALFEDGLAADPSHGPLHSARAKFEARYGTVESARQLLRDASEKYPCATIWSAWGKLEERCGHLTTAAELYEQGARSGSGRDDTSYLWHALGSVLLQQRQLAAALEAFEEGLQRTPASSQLLLGVAIVHSQLGHFERARAMFLRSVQADASHAHAWQAWGVMEARMGNAEVARDLYRRGLRRCPQHAALWSATARLEGEAGELERARRLFRTGVERCPGAAALLVAWAYFEMHQGKTIRATELLARAKQADVAAGSTNAGEVHHVHALLLLKTGKPQEARRAVDEGLAAAPTHAPLYRVLGAMQDVAGDVEAARASFREGLRLNPGYAQLYHAYARLEGKLGNWGALSELNQRAKAAFPAPVEAAPGELQSQDARAPLRGLGDEMDEGE